MPRDPRIEKLQRLRIERTTRASGSYYGTRATAYGNVRSGPRQRDMGRTLLSLALFVVIGTVALYLAIQYVAHGYRTPTANQQEHTVTVTIPSGETASDLATQLHGKGLVGNSTLFYVYLRLSGANWTAGTHRLRTGMTTDEVAQAIAGPAVADEVKVTIGDGWRAEQVAQALAAAHVASYADVMNQVQKGNFPSHAVLTDRPVGATLEGYLYPDTYNFVLNEGAHSAIDRILSNFDAKVSTQVQAQGRKMYGGSFYKAIVMASIVQREAGTARDDGLIASTLLNRLHDQTGQYPNLGADATVQYAVGHAPDWWHDPTADDLATATHSHFDTRVYPGLPPTPISEPNMVSIEAAINPPRTSYFSYYHVKGSHGKSIFCTFQEGVGCKGIPQ